MNHKSLKYLTGSPCVGHMIYGIDTVTRYDNRIVNSIDKYFNECKYLSKNSTWKINDLLLYNENIRYKL